VVRNAINPGTDVAVCPGPCVDEGFPLAPAGEPIFGAREEPCRIRDPLDRHLQDRRDAGAEAVGVNPVERSPFRLPQLFKVLAEAGLVQVARTRRVRAIARSASTVAPRGCSTSASSGAGTARICPEASTTSRSPPLSRPAPTVTGSCGVIRHARISEAQASEFWERMAELVAEFDRLPRSGETMYGFAVGIYPTDQPTLPDATEEASAEAG
jgi:hypothetical protein